MYTAHSKFGIGEVIESTDNKVTIYFPEEDVTKILLASLVTIYATIEEAELAINTELTNEEKEASYAEIKAADEDYKKGQAANAWLRDYNYECSKKLMKHI